MFNLWKKYKAKKRIQEKLEAEDIANKIIKRQSLISELYTQSLQNVTYLDSVIKTTMSQIYNIKTRGSEKNKIRKEFLKNQLDWYKIKLSEEKSLVTYYGVST